jgi:trimeric autotransporter adhesin
MKLKSFIPKTRLGRGTKRSSSLSVSAANASFVPEIEGLESRILLSGITPGKEYRTLNYVDADGDKVKISLKGGSFTVDGIFDGKTALTMDQITITSAKANSVFSIDVQKVRPTSDGIGATFIGDINSGGLDFKGIRLNGATVDSLSLAGTDLTSIQLQAKAAIILDRTSEGGSGATALVNWGSVDVNSVQLLQSQAAPRTIAIAGPFMNFNGPITVADGETSIVGRTSNINGALNVNNLDGLQVAGFGAGANVNTQGDLTLKLPNGAAIGAAVFNAGGDIHLSVAAGGLGGATFNAGGSISGSDVGSTTDVVTVGGTVAGTNFNAATGFAGISVSGGDMNAATINTTAGAIGDITAAQGEINNAGLTLTGDSIGNIKALNITTGAITANTGDIGDISATGSQTLAQGTITTGGILAKAGSIGDITAAGGGITGTITAGTAAAGTTPAVGGDIGNITAFGKVANNITAFNGSIGDIAITGGSLIGNVVVGTANSAQLDAVGGDIGAITLTGTATAPVALNGAVTSFNGGIGDVTLVEGNINGNITAGSASAKVGQDASGGDIGAISVTHSQDDLNGILGAINTVNGSIGNIDVTLSGDAAGGFAGIWTAITSGKDIGQITVNTSGTSAVPGDMRAINANITAAGDIAGITAISTGAGSVGFAGGVTISAVNIGDIVAQGTETAANAKDAIAINGGITIGDATADTGTGSIGNITITGATAGAVTLLGRVSGSGFAGTSVGNITMVSNDAADNLTVNATNMWKLGNVSLTGGTGALTLTSGGVNLQQVGDITSAKNADISGLTNTALTNFGSVSIDGTGTFGTAMAKATTAGDFSVDTLGALALNTNINIGAGGAGSSIGAIVIGNDIANNGTGQYVFNFATYNGTPDARVVAPAPAQDLTGGGAPSLAGGIVLV